jgi:hypothetical protein
MSPVNELIAYYDPGDDLSATCDGAVTGKRFVSVSANKEVGSQALANDTLGGNIVVAQSGAGDRALGVATYDQIDGKKVPVVRGHKVVPVEAGAAANAGDECQSDATGRAIALAAGKPLGVFLNSPTAAGQTAIVALDL